MILKLKIDTNDELADLERSFNDMAFFLRRKISYVKNIYQTILKR